MKHLFHKSSIIICVAGMMLAGVGQAGIIYQALPNQSGATDMNAAIVADSFILANPITVQNIRFWSLQGGLSDYTGSIEWSINSDSSGLPGTSLGSGLATPTGIVTGLSGFGLNEFSYSWAVSVALNAGTYWVELHNGPSSAVPATSFFWGWNNANAGNGQTQDIAPQTQPWIAQSASLALQLDGAVSAVPEPGTVMLGAVGLLGTMLIRARRVRRAR